MADDLGGELRVASANPTSRQEKSQLTGRRRRGGAHSRALLAALISLALLAAALATILPDAPSAFAASDARAAARASCATLAGVDPTATNGRSWGRTILAGGGAKGGWFGVDVCSNGFNSAAPNGSNVSCDRVPTNWFKSGCAPGSATSDGYGWTFQCPELVIRFSAWAFGDKPSDWGRSGNGNAPDLWQAANHPSDFVMYRNGSSHAPVPGDILVWGYLDGNGNPWPAGPNGSHGGHIAVVAAVRNGMVITAEQNVKWGSEDHPSDKLALTKLGSRWILSGSTSHQKTLPTYRWLSTMGTSRGTFGWLHNVKNTGTFPSSKSPAKKPTPTPTAPDATASQQPPSQQTPGGMPTLASATVVTKDGQLADLAWSTQSFFADSSPGDPQDAQPYAQARSLGSPPSVGLSPGQTPASVVTASGMRFTYAIGTDGHLYAARTGPELLGVFWSDLGAPSGVSLAGSAVASLFGGGIAIAAQGTDGKVYWCAGPIGTPGAWSAVGAPSGVALSDSLAVTGAPGVGMPLILALSTNGVLYERIWQDATIAADGTTEIPAGWSEWLAVGGQPKDVRFGGQLLVVPELPSTNKWIGSWPDSPLNVFALDRNGGVWWLRSPRLTSGWTAAQLQGPVPITDLLAGVAVAAQDKDGATAITPGDIQLYATAQNTTYTVAAAIPSGGSKQSPASLNWTSLAALPAATAVDATGIAVPLAAATSVVIVSSGDDLLVGGVSDATSIALPNAQVAAGTPVKAKNPWLAAGNVAAAMPAFSDPLTGTTMDGRWQLRTPKAQSTAKTDGLRLVPNKQGVASLTQGALPDDATLTVRVSAFNTLASGAHAGLVFYLDDADWMTLTVDGGGTVALCAMAWQQAVPCISQEHVASAKDRSVWLRVLRTEDTFTAMASTDGTSWRTIGQWTPTASDSQNTQGAQAQVTPSPAITVSPSVTATASPSPAATATPSAATAQHGDPTVAPLAFASWGILTQGDGTRRSWPAFTDFSVAVSAPVGG
jgi:hypothetical protein